MVIIWFLYGQAAQSDIFFPGTRKMAPVWQAFAISGPQAALEVLRQFQPEDYSEELRLQLGKAAFYLAAGEYMEARKLALAVEPYLALNHGYRALTYLLMAEAGYQLAKQENMRPIDALHMIIGAAQECSFPSARIYLFPLHLLYALISSYNGDRDSALQHLRAAERLKKKVTQSEKAVYQQVRGTIFYTINRLESIRAFGEAKLLATLPAQAKLTDEPLERLAIVEEDIGNSCHSMTRKSINIYLLGQISIEIEGHIMAVPRYAYPLLLLCYLETHSGASKESVSNMILPTIYRDSKDILLIEKLEKYRLDNLIKQTRNLLMDSSCIIQSDSSLYISSKYKIVSDLNNSLRQGSFRRELLPSGLQCQWLEDLEG